MENLHVKLETDKETVTLRQGAAPKILEPQQYSFTGNLQAPRTYLDKHRENALDQNRVDEHLAIIEVNQKNMSITLKTNPASPLSTVIKGELKLSDDLELFGINSTKLYTRDEFVKLIKFSRIYFGSSDEHARVLNAVQKFSVKTTGELSAESDTRGNRRHSYDKRVNWDGPEQFKLQIPLFKGYKPVQFVVDVCIDVSESQARFWLESVELADLITIQRDQLIAEQLSGLDADFVVMYH